MKAFSVQKLITYFFRGLLVVVPFVVTVFIMIRILEWLDGLIPVKFPGLGIFIIITAITLLGYFASFFITKSLLDQLEKYLVKIPLVNIIYTSIKDLVTAFVGEGQKFNVPVTVAFNESKTVLKIGFITQEELETLNLPGYVSVYLPHSYNFSGNHFLVAKECVKPLNMKGSDAMKFVVSGGVSGFDPKQINQEK